MAGSEVLWDDYMYTVDKKKQETRAWRRKFFAINIER